MPPGPGPRPVTVVRTVAGGALKLDSDQQRPELERVRVEPAPLAEARHVRRAGPQHGPGEPSCAGEMGAARVNRLGHPGQPALAVVAARASPRIPAPGRKSPIRVALGTLVAAVPWWPP